MYEWVCDFWLVDLGKVDLMILSKKIEVIMFLWIVLDLFGIFGWIIIY